MGGDRAIPSDETSQDSLYAEAACVYAHALDRLARAYERNDEARRDLLQDIHLQLWRSFGQFDGRCSVRTWVYRIAHNVATKHVIRQRRMHEKFVSIEDAEAIPDANHGAFASGQSQALERLRVFIQSLKTLDRQIIVLYLEGVDAISIGEITGLSPANVAKKVHRIKIILRSRFGEGETHAG